MRIERADGQHQLHGGRLIAGRSFLFIKTLTNSGGLF